MNQVRKRFGFANRESIGSWSERFSAAATEWTGRTSAFVLAVLLVVVWALTGPLFHYSEGWQLFINSVTNLVTFLMVFLIQRAQNKDTLALQLKVNELIASHKGAHNALIAIEQLSESDLRVLQDRFVRLASSTAGRQSASVTDVKPITEPPVGPMAPDVSSEERELSEEQAARSR